MHHRREYSLFKITSVLGYVMAGATRLSPNQVLYLNFIYLRFSQNYMKC